MMAVACLRLYSPNRNLIRLRSWLGIMPFKRAPRSSSQ
jgi:hypothetical protein